MVVRALHRHASTAQILNSHPRFHAIASTSQSSTYLYRRFASSSSENTRSIIDEPSPTVKRDTLIRGPIQNRTWPPCPPLKKVNLSPRKRESSHQSTDTTSAREQNLSNFNVASRPNTQTPSALGQRRNYSSRGLTRKWPSDQHSSSEPSENISESTGASSQAQIPAQKVSDEAATPQESDNEPSEPMKPLPDLRQGIPSSLEETEDFGSSKRAASHSTSLNVTEDPDAGYRRSEGELPKGAYVSSIERRRNAVARYLYITFAAFALTGSAYLGQNWANEEEAKKHPDAPNGWAPSAFYARIKERLSSQLGYYTEPTSPTLLPPQDLNYFPPYTLVISLEDLLISSKWSRSKGWEVAKRPGVDYFIRYLSQYYELVLFTTVPSMNAEMVLRKLDPYRIMQPLFREATRYVDGEHVKDLSYLNRDLSKTIIIDTNPSHVRKQPENAIILPKWSGEKGDSHAKDLVALIPLLEFIAGMSVDDVRKILKSYEGVQDIPAEFQRREAVARAAFNESQQAGKSKKGRLGSGMGSLSSALGLKPSQPRIPGEPSLEEGLAQGKMLSDLIRERGQKNYVALEKDFQEKGQEWLKQMEDEEKRMQEESMQSMTKSIFGMIGAGNAAGANNDSKN